MAGVFDDDEFEFDFAALDAIEAQHAAGRSQAGPAQARQPLGAWPGQNQTCHAAAARPPAQPQQPKTWAPQPHSAPHAGRGRASPWKAGSQAQPRAGRGAGSQGRGSQHSGGRGSQPGTQRAAFPRGMQSVAACFARYKCQAEQRAQPTTEPLPASQQPQQQQADAFGDDDFGGSFDWAAFDLHCEAAAGGVAATGAASAPQQRPSQQRPSQAPRSQQPAAEEVPPASLLSVPDENEPELIETATLNPGLRVHRRSAAHWVYPAGVPERVYQIQIIRTALLNNTLVCLPTGLGKTLIAAVVMHNFARWFPQGKVIFLAPTRPLVTQQIEACRRFMGVREESLQELTGNTSAATRAGIWASPAHRIFFCTPQVFKNDAVSGTCPIHLVTCVTVDECHRATGNADVVLAIRRMAEAGLKFRVLGLSATPGRDRKAIQEVVSNLMVSRIEVREETHPDVVRHVHPRHVQVIVVPLGDGELAEARSSLLHCLRGALTKLVGRKLYYGVVNPEQVSSHPLREACRRYQTSHAGSFDPGVYSCFRQAQVLADARKLLDEYGAESAARMLEGKESEAALRSLLSTQPFQLFKRQLQGVCRSGGPHPKMRALQQCVLEHFGLQLPGAGPQQQQQQQPPQQLAAGMRPGRLIIFSSTRDSVADIMALFKPHEPHILARTFVGQAKGGRGGSGGISQKEQQATLAAFRAGAFNVLVATCIGEEGLDICQVEKVICFDAFQSPIRNIQRMGRTGRHEAGHVVHILGEGAEERKYQQNLANIAGLYDMLRGQSFQMNADNPRMLSRRFSPAQLNVDCTPEEPPPPPPPPPPDAPAAKSKGRKRKAAQPAAAAAPPPTEGLGYAALAQEARRGRGRGGGRGGGRPGRTAQVLDDSPPASPRQQQQQAQPPAEPAQQPAAEWQAAASEAAARDSGSGVTSVAIDLEASEPQQPRSSEAWQGAAKPMEAGVTTTPGPVSPAAEHWPSNDAAPTQPASAVQAAPAAEQAAEGVLAACEPEPVQLSPPPRSPAQADLDWVVPETPEQESAPAAAETGSGGVPAALPAVAALGMRAAGSSAAAEPEPELRPLSQVPLGAWPCVVVSPRRPIRPSRRVPAAQQAMESAVLSQVPLRSWPQLAPAPPRSRSAAPKPKPQLPQPQPPPAAQQRSPSPAPEALQLSQLPLSKRMRRADRSGSAAAGSRQPSLSAEPEEPQLSQLPLSKRMRSTPGSVGLAPVVEEQPEAQAAVSPQLELSQLPLAERRQQRSSTAQPAGALLAPVTEEQPEAQAAASPQWELSQLPLAKRRRQQQQQQHGSAQQAGVLLSPVAEEQPEAQAATSPQWELSQLPLAKRRQQQCGAAAAPGRQPVGGGAQPEPEPELQLSQLPLWARLQPPAAATAPSTRHPVCEIGSGAVAQQPATAQPGISPDAAAPASGSSRATPQLPAQTRWHITPVAALPGPEPPPAQLDCWPSQAEAGDLAIEVDLGASQPPAAVAAAAGPQQRQPDAGVTRPLPLGGLPPDELAIEVDLGDWPSEEPAQPPAAAALPQPALPPVAPAPPQPAQPPSSERAAEGVLADDLAIDFDLGSPQPVPRAQPAQPAAQPSQPQLTQPRGTPCLAEEGVLADEVAIDVDLGSSQHLAVAAEPAQQPSRAAAPQAARTQPGNELWPEDAHPACGAAAAELAADAGQSRAAEAVQQAAAAPAAQRSPAAQPPGSAAAGGSPEAGVGGAVNEAPRPASRAASPLHQRESDAAATPAAAMAPPLAESAVQPPQPTASVAGQPPALQTEGPAPEPQQAASRPASPLPPRTVAPVAAAAAAAAATPQLASAERQAQPQQPLPNIATGGGSFRRLNRPQHAPKQAKAWGFAGMLKRSMQAAQASPAPVPADSPAVLATAAPAPAPPPATEEPCAPAARPQSAQPPGQAASQAASQARPGQLGRLRDQLFAALGKPLLAAVPERRSPEEQDETPAAQVRRRRCAHIVESTPRLAAPPTDQSGAAAGLSSGPVFRRPLGRLVMLSDASPAQPSPAASAPASSAEPHRKRKRRRREARGGGRGASQFVDVEAGLSSDGEGGGEDEGSEEGDAYESDFVSQTQEAHRPRSKAEVAMYHRSLLERADATPALLRRRRRAREVLPDTPASDGVGERGEEPEEEEDSFIDGDEREDGHLLASTLKGGQSQHDERCGLCGGGGGGLLGCAGCPAAFHPACLGLARAPRAGDWFCAVCRDGR